MVAATMGHLDVVRLLVKAGARKDLLTDDGKTSLDLAVLGKHTKVLHFLVHAGLPPGPCVKIVLFFMPLKMPWTAWIVLFFLQQYAVAPSRPSARTKLYSVVHHGKTR